MICQVRRHKADGKPRAAGDVQIQGMIALLQRSAIQLRDIGNDSKGFTARLNEDQRSLVLCVRDKAPHRGSEAPIRLVRELEPVNKRMQLHRRSRLEPGGYMDPRTLTTEPNFADHLQLPDRKLFNQFRSIRDYLQDP